MLKSFFMIIGMWSGILFGLCCIAVADNPMLTLTINGKSLYDIVVPNSDPGRRVGKAADLLQSIVEQSAGCKLPIVKESAASNNKPHIYLGKTQAAKKAGIPFDKLKDWTFCKRVIGKNIFLVGCDESANMKGGLSYHDREYLMKIGDMRLNKDIKDRSYKGFMGTYKAVSSFLEKQLGVRFLLPGPNGLHVPRHKILTISSNIDYVGSARFPFCFGRSCYGDITIPLNHNEIPYFKTYGGHSFPYAVSKHKYSKSHPEYFVMVDGKRRPDYGPGGAGHLCISNPEVQELMMKELERQYHNGCKWVELGQTDGCVHCQCEKCKELAKNGYGDALWQVYRKIAEKMKKRCPGLKIVCMAYSDTKNPPTSFHDFPDNVIIELTSWDDWPETFARWKKIKVPKLVYTYNWGEYHTTIFCPKRSLQYLAKQLRLFDKNDVIGIFKCYMGEALGLDGPAYYVYSQLLFDPYADPQKIADDFYRVAYGKAYAPMKRLFDSMYKNLDFKDGTSKIGLLNTQPRNPDIQISFIFQPYLVLHWEKLLNHAMKLDHSPKVQARLKLVKRELDYLKNLVEIYAYNNTYNLSHSPEAFRMLDAAVRRRDKMLDSWYDANGKMIQEPGFNWPFFMNLPKKVVRNGGGQVCTPFPGLLARVEKLRKTIKTTAPQQSPGTKTTKEKVTTAVYLDSPVAVAKFLGKKAVLPAVFGSQSEAVNFSVAYDDHNLYFRFVNRFSNVDEANFCTHNAGYDKPYNMREGLEIFLDVEVAQKRYYHFVFSPAKHAKFDGRCGFITDSLHPDYGKEDKSWNGKWEYETDVLPAENCWTAVMTIPFATLGTKLPKNDDSFRMEIVRRHFPAGSGNPSGAQVSSWTSNFDDSYCDPADFGRLDFVVPVKITNASYQNLKKKLLALCKRKKYTEALEVINQMQTEYGTSPNLPDIMLKRLQVLNFQRDYNAIVTAFSESELAKVKGPHGTFCRRLVGAAYEVLGQYDKAIDQYDRASKLLTSGPHVGIVRMMKAECERNKLKDITAALKSYQKAVDTAGYAESAKTMALYQIAKIQFSSGNKEQALAAIDQITQQKNPNAKWKAQAIKLKQQYSGN